VTSIGPAGLVVEQALSASGRAMAAKGMASLRRAFMAGPFCCKEGACCGQRTTLAIRADGTTHRASPSRPLKRGLHAVLLDFLALRHKWARNDGGIAG